MMLHPATPAIVQKKPETSTAIASVTAAPPTGWSGSRRSDDSANTATLPGASTISMGGMASRRVAAMLTRANAYPGIDHGMRTGASNAGTSNELPFSGMAM